MIRMTNESKIWYHIVAHGIGPPGENGQPYESEILSIDDELVIYDDIEDMRSFMDNINIFVATKGRVLGKTLPFVILEIQATEGRMNTGTESIEWYVYSMKNKIYINIGVGDPDKAIDAYNELNEGYI